MELVIPSRRRRYQICMTLIHFSWHFSVSKWEAAKLNTELKISPAAENTNAAIVVVLPKGSSRTESICNSEIESLSNNYQPKFINTDMWMYRQAYGTRRVHPRQHMRHMFAKASKTSSQSLTYRSPWLVLTCRECWSCALEFLGVYLHIL